MLAVLAIAELLGMSLWFGASAVAGELGTRWSLDTATPAGHGCGEFRAAGATRRSPGDPDAVRVQDVDAEGAGVHVAEPDGPRTVWPAAPAVADGHGYGNVGNVHIDAHADNGKQARRFKCR